MPSALHSEKRIHSHDQGGALKPLLLAKYLSLAPLSLLLVGITTNEVLNLLRCIIECTIDLSKIVLADTREGLVGDPVRGNLLCFPNGASGLRMKQN